MHIPQNLFSPMPSHLAGELFTSLFKDNKLHIERIVSQGHSSPENEWYDQDDNEWVLVLQGRARLHYAEENSFIELNTGDYIFIPAHVKHRVDWTDPQIQTIWLAIHSKP